ncbi:MAG TPA: gephyrin-like molybdotransferase Glp [Nannocystaceae bacterium]|nr:gephyrin-like molybdotransferase Glp [Nannocystaceae bacterium]
MSLATLAEAQRIALAAARPTTIVELPLAAAAHCVLARDLVALRDLPGADVSIMDGYAVQCDALRGGGIVELAIAGESAAGRPWTGTLARGQALRISTGAVLPAGADMVVAQEDTTRRGDVVAIDSAKVTEIRAGRWVRAQGSDVTRGSAIAEAGLRLGPAELALLGACGHAIAPVHRRPRVAILSTGDELVRIGEPAALGQVIATSGLMLTVACNDAGADVVSESLVIDDADRLHDALVHAHADLVLTTGGASVGDHDLVRAGLARLGGRELVWGIAMRPGKPTGIVALADTLVVALPGNPAASFVGFELIVRPMLRRMAGVRGEPCPALRTAIAGAAIPGERGREPWVRARIDHDRVLPLVDQLSGNLRSIADATVLVRVPAGITEIAAGEPCELLVLDHRAHERPA